MYNPKHRQTTKTREFLALEAQDFEVFTSGGHLKPRGRRAVKAADSILRACENGERQRRANQATEIPAAVAA